MIPTRPRAQPTIRRKKIVETVYGDTGFQNAWDDLKIAASSPYATKLWRPILLGFLRTMNVKCGTRFRRHY